MAIDYGTDVSCGADLDALLRDVSGDANMLLVCLRRCYTPPGGMLSAPTANTIDARSFLGQGFDLSSDRDLTRVQALVSMALLDDERIFSVTVVPTYVLAEKRLELSINAVGANGPFSLTLGVDSLTVSLLNG